jgi:hypothetical protein
VETTKSYIITPKQYIVIQQMAKVNHRWHVTTYSYRTSNVIDDKMYVLSYNTNRIVVLRHYSKNYRTNRTRRCEKFKLLNLYTELTKEHWEALGIGYDEYINNIKLNKQ